MNEDFGRLLADTLKQMLDAINANRETTHGTERGLLALLRILAEKGMIDAADLTAVEAAMTSEKDRADGP